MAGAVGGVRVEGLADLNRAFGKASTDLKRELKNELVKAGEPVRADAESLAISGIRNIGGRWSRMRLGVTTRLVYVAPKSRRRRGSPRGNLAPLLMTRALEPALDARTPEVLSLFEAMLDRVGDENGF